LLGLLESGDLEREYPDWPAHLAGRAGEAFGAEHATAREYETELKAFLRRFRQREMMRIIWRDQCRGVSLEQTCADMSDMADAIVQFALDGLHPWCVRELGEPRAADG